MDLLKKEAGMRESDIVINFANRAIEVCKEEVFKQPKGQPSKINLDTWRWLNGPWVVLQEDMVLLIAQPPFLLQQEFGPQ